MRRIGEDPGLKTDPVAYGLTDLLAQLPGHKGGGQPGRQRGSSIRIVLPASQNSAKRARGATVVLPEPGGALSTTT